MIKMMDSQGKACGTVWEPGVWYGCKVGKKQGRCRGFDQRMAPCHGFEVYDNVFLATVMTPSTLCVPWVCDVDGAYVTTPFEHRYKRCRIVRPVKPVILTFARRIAFAILCTIYYKASIDELYIPFYNWGKAWLAGERRCGGLEYLIDGLPSNTEGEGFVFRAATDLRDHRCHIANALRCIKDTSRIMQHIDTLIAWSSDPRGVNITPLLKG